MKKLQTLLVLAAGVLLASCGGKDHSADSELDSYVEAARKGFLGEKGGEIIELFTKMETTDMKANELANKETTSAAGLEKTAEELGELITELNTLKEQWKNRAEELGKELNGVELSTELADGIPLELVKPFAITLFKKDYFRLACSVKLTKKRPAISSQSAKSQPFGYYNVKAVLLDSSNTPIDTVALSSSDGYSYVLEMGVMNDYKEIEAGKEFRLETTGSFEKSAFNLFNPTPKTWNTIHLLSAKKILIIWEHPFEDKTALAQPGRGDLGGYDLRGPVKKVSYDEWNVTFNEQGQIVAENGQTLKSIFPGGVKRDKDGRLTECNADGYGSRYYTYNEKGLPTEINEDGFARQMTYDADGYVATETSTVAPEMGDEEGELEVITNKYTILDKDSYGNWTKRKDQEGNVTTRSITYFN